MTTIYLLFQTDAWRTKSSRVFFGAFSTKKLALKAAKENDLFNDDSDVLILETNLNEFYEQ